MILRKEFYFIRHGQTDHNKSTPRLDNEDISLNDTGWKQASEIESIIAALPIKTICFSPLRRAKETKEVISARLFAQHCELPDLAECSGQVWEEMTTIGAEAYLTRQEPVKVFMQQVLTGINQALSQPGPVLIVAHGGVHWAMCCYMNVEHEWAIDNCIPVHFFFGEDGRWQAKKLV